MKNNPLIFLANFILEKDLIASVISAFTTVLISKRLIKSQNIELTRERLNKVLFPIYKLLNGYFFNYQETNISFLAKLSEIKHILAKNQLIAGHNLYHAFEIFEKEIKLKYKKRAFNKFCNILIDDYSKSCKQIGLPKLNIIYRISNHQYTLLHSIFYSIVYILKTIFWVILIGTTYAITYVSVKDILK